MSNQVIEYDGFSETTDDLTVDGQPRRRFYQRIFNRASAAKAADIAARFGVTNLAKAGAMTASGAIIGATASFWVTSAIAIGAAGLATGAYTYARESWRDYKTASAAGDEFHFISMSRAKKAGISLLCGVAGGAIGSWLAHTDLAQSALRWTVETAGPAIHDALVNAGVAIGFLKPAADAIVDAAAPDVTPDATPAPVASETVTTETVAHAAGSKASAAASAATEQASATTTDTAAATVKATVDVSSSQPADINVSFNGDEVNHGGSGSPIDDIIANAGTQADAGSAVSRAAEALSASDSHLSAALANGTASPQMLKDAAHEVLRLDSVPSAERFEIARALAEQAQAQGNTQAATFLADLDRMTGAAHHAAQAAATTAAATGAETATQETFTAGAGLAPDFEVAARCTATFDLGSNNVSDVACEYIKSEMGANSGVVFTDSAAPDRIVTTVLDADSVTIPTEGFVNEDVLSDGISRLAALRPR